MNWPNIEFSEAEKNKFQKMAFELEQKISVDSVKYKDLAAFSQYPPFVEALNLAKEKKIDKPIIVNNTNYWYCETNLGEWIKAEKTGILSKFLLAIEGFPYEDNDDG